MFDFINNLANLKLYQKFIILFLVVLLAYGLTLGMYIWQDDNAIMFKLQNLEEGGGNLGHGIYDRNTPYRGVIVPLVPLYYFFGLEPVGYFVVGLIVYFLASVLAASVFLGTAGEAASLPLGKYFSFSSTVAARPRYVRLESTAF